MKSFKDITFILLNKDVEDTALFHELLRLQSMTKINDKRKFDVNYPHVSQLIEILKGEILDEEEKE